MVCAVVFQMPHCRYIYIAHLTLLNYKHLSRDVKTVYFSEPVTGLPKPGFLPVTERTIVSGIIVTGRSALAISRSLVASRRPWPAFQTHGRRRCETKDSGVSKQ